LRQQQAAAARIWLLLRHLDRRNCGWVQCEQAAEWLTGKNQPLRICGRRQWQNLLRQGENLFWQQENGRLWLRSVARVAAALGVERLSGTPIALPVAVLTQGIAAVRAHLYASFHSGRTNSRRGEGRPIARQTLQALSSVSRRSQRAYEQRTHVGVRSNSALGPLTTPLTDQEQAWQRGHALYQLTDQHGRYGRPNASYLAWQLPNSYCGPHKPMPRGRQKRINRELADLFTNGMTGNGVLPQERPTSAGRFSRRSYCHSAKSAQLMKRGKEEDKTIYWQATESRHDRLWYLWENP
jgi:hypothetical protein